MNGFYKCLSVLAMACALSTTLLATQTASPPTAEVLNQTPQVALYPHFLSDEECDHLIAMANPELKRSKVMGSASVGDELDSRRTSQGMFFPYGCTDQTVRNIEARIAAMTGFPVENGENIQVLHYDVGGEYQPHYDYFDKNTASGVSAMKHGGQRIVTFIMYLADTPDGGETIFPKLKLKIEPKKGCGLLFYNCSPEGVEDPLSFHGGAPVLKGEKWIATKWIRKGPFK